MASSSSSSSAMQMLRRFLRFVKDLFFLTAFQSAPCKKNFILIGFEISLDSYSPAQPSPRSRASSSSSSQIFPLFHPLHLPHLRCSTLTKRHTPPPRRARPNHSCSCHLPPFPVTPSPPSGPPSSVTPSGPFGPSSVAPPGPSVGRGPPVGVNSWK